MNQHVDESATSLVVHCVLVNDGRTLFLRHAVTLSDEAGTSTFFYWGLPVTERQAAETELVAAERVIGHLGLWCERRRLVLPQPGQVEWGDYTGQHHCVRMDAVQGRHRPLNMDDYSTLDRQWIPHELISCYPVKRLTRVALNLALSVG